MTKKVLIVDDIPSNLQVGSQIFKGRDYQIALAESGKSALEILKQDDFDVILLDIMMPGMDGFEVCRIIREELKLDVPVIFLTAKTEKKDIIKGFDKGGQDYVTKPFDAMELLARVDTHAELYRTRQELKHLNKTLQNQVAEQTLDLKLRNTELIKANEKLQSLDDAKLEFLNIISHELRTPLHGIRGYAELIGIYNESDHISEYVKILFDSIQRLEDFAMLAFNITSLKLNKYRIKHLNIDIRASFYEAIRNQESVINSKQLNVKLINFDFPVHVSCEALLINRAISIIIENAIKHSQSHTRVEVDYERGVNQHIFSIWDRGMGFNDHVLQNEMGLFNAGKKHIDTNMGLNLPLANLIIIAHNGAMEIKNHPDGGGLVSVKLPFNPE